MKRITTVLVLICACTAFAAHIDGPEVPQIDLPQSQRLHNTGGRDGAGLCVFTSITHAARWAGVVPLDEFQSWMERHPGGGYPEKVDRMIKEICAEKNVPVPQYVQVEGPDYSIVRLACKTGRMPCITYNHSPSGRYHGMHISHMVNCVSAKGDEFAILDNNFPKDLEWLSENEFKSVYGGKNGWTFVLLEPGAPPAPKEIR